MAAGDLSLAITNKWVVTPSSRWTYTVLQRYTITEKGAGN